MTHNDLDNIVKDALNDIQYPYSSSDWEMMSKKLDDDKRIRTKLYLFKGVEVILTIASVWAIYQYVGNTLQPTISVLPQQTLALPQSPTTPSTTTNTTTTQQINEPNSPKPAIAAYRTQATNPTTVATTTPNHPTQIAASTHTAPITHHTSTLQKNISSAASQNNIPNSNNNAAEYPLPTQNTNIPIPHTEAHRTFQQTNLDILPTQPLQDIQSYQSISEKHLTIHQPPLGKIVNEPIELKRRRQYRLGCFVSPDMNFVPQSVNLGFSVGATTTIGFSKRIELETGISYSNKSFVYKRRGIPDQTGVMQYEEYQLRYANYHMASIPINLQINLNKSPNWRAYLTTGAAANFMLTADFLRYPGANEPAPIEEGGLIQGGSFGNNFYASTDFGIGLERKLANNGHLYIQPSYRQALDATGPEHHKVGSFSLVVGAKTNL